MYKIYSFIAQNLMARYLAFTVTVLCISAGTYAYVSIIVIYAIYTCVVTLLCYLLQHNIVITHTSKRYCASKMHDEEVRLAKYM